VLAGVGGLGEEAGRLDHHVDAEVAPGQRTRVALGQDFDLLAVDRDAGVGDRDLVLERAENAVVLQQVGHRLHVAEVVGGDDLDVLMTGVDRTPEVAADAAEAVDADADRHGGPPLLQMFAGTTLPGAAGTAGPESGLWTTGRIGVTGTIKG